MYKLSKLINSPDSMPINENTPQEQWIPARPMNEDLKTLSERIKDAWAVFTNKASAFTWD